MSVSVFEHPWLGGLFGDPAMAEILSAERTLSHMLAFEAAWSRACGSAGLFDPQKAEAAARAIEGARIDLGDLAEGTGRDGLPVPQLVAQLKTLADPAAVHRGATSQDVLDTATVLALREASDLIAQRLDELSEVLDDLDARFGSTPLMGRTRMQAATEITVHDRLATWREPLTTHRARLAEIRPRVELVQVGGASGDRKALGDQADAVVGGVAKALGLAPTARSWHAMRDGIVEYASWLSLVSGTMGKLGQDIALMAQQGIGEIAVTGTGSSSAMPHKQNPVKAELLVTLARFNAVQVGAMHHALIHEQERSGSGWALEWMVLPQMLMTTGRATSAAIELCQSIETMGSPGLR
ncbi:3-carboxy-cis,cis-muconate cycloisomerase [Brevirhabdus pacifica]|uniref:3-carboxy-cis,cis-muconate cycloisomerase n=1 Tax=Brevirhabdus pacifica TaxID=1267768 RepID=A0A1U7DHL2_9RHOB|nr:3-carboxy-cis,cis-muconate cycloisomerase [Brevirhabdus pacifica]APX89451.1 3-carboxy-cis,cis-muconate cycloisomerase [Brevirhabdus pacifica]OWU76532.1 3-carboxy-cis,cis-muconate cycloisomerase [Loktanella sp. 22II-4b]PJJ85904.1 3-carboxy-cis,cis-muconate cycloisomerase [Brevirhabdus pacifica]